MPLERASNYASTVIRQFREVEGGFESQPRPIRDSIGSWCSFANPGMRCGMNVLTFANSRVWQDETQGVVDDARLDFVGVEQECCDWVSGGVGTRALVAARKRLRWRRRCPVV